MAAAPQADFITITINDQEVQVPKGELIVESVKRIGLEIPIFCYHPRMKPVGMCRMCLVEVGFTQQDGSVRKMPKPQAACTLPASEGMVVYTDTEAVHKDRRGVLEFLLINHPLDCPICDRGGECPLQNNTLAYGPSTSRFTEMKRHLPKAYPLSKYVTLDLERCIQCGRCVRFTEEISGDHQLAFRFRGAEMQPSTFQLTDFESKFSGNVIEICPVGALTSTRYRFRARPWDLETRPALCTVTPCGTNIWFDYRGTKFVRINGRTNEAVNEEWTCDKTKFGHDFYNDPNRLTSPYVRKGDDFAATGWSEAYTTILQNFEGKGEECAALVKPNVSNEDLYMLQKLFRKGFGSNSIDHRMRSTLQPHGERMENKHGINPVQAKIAELEDQDSVLIFGTSLADEEPMTYLRVRKGWFNHGTKVVVAHHEPTDADSFAHTVLRYREGTAETLAAGLRALMGGDGPSAEDVESKTGVSAASLKEAAEVLKGRTAIITTRGLLEQPGGPAAAEHLAQSAKQSGAKFNLMALECNEQGALELGVLPDTLPGGGLADTKGRNTKEILEAAANGQIKALWLVNCDPLTDYPDRALAERALENVEFLVVQHFRQTEACEFASVILPMALPAEQDGSYTSTERRVQRMAQVIPAPGDAKPGWRIFTECLVRMTPMTPAFNPREIMEEISREVPHYHPAGYERISVEGVLIIPEKFGIEAVGH